MMKPSKKAPAPAPMNYEEELRRAADAAKQADAGPTTNNETKSAPARVHAFLLLVFIPSSLIRIRGGAARQGAGCVRPRAPIAFQLRAFYLKLRANRMVRRSVARDSLRSLDLS